MYKQDLALDNLQWLIGHKNQPTNQSILDNFRFKKYILNINNLYTII